MPPTVFKTVTRCVPHILLKADSQQQKSEARKCVDEFFPSRQSDLAAKPIKLPACLCGLQDAVAMMRCEEAVYPGVGVTSGSRFDLLTEGGLTGSQTSRSFPASGQQSAV